MTPDTTVFSRLAGSLERLRAERQRTIDDAFASVCAQKQLLATFLVEQFGDAHRAARWMASHQRTFGGRSPLEVLADGDEDALWDALHRAAVNGEDGGHDVGISAAR